MDSLSGVERFASPRLVGQGGMGELYEVWDTRLERRVAVKRLNASVLLKGDGAQMVLREARAAAKIEHPNVVRIYGVEVAQGEMLIEMQFIEGQPLNNLLRGMPLPGELAADLLGQILDGLMACHARNVIHCDLKPANILVTADGTVYLTDFGIARALRTPMIFPAPTDSSVARWGTPRYAPPEAWHCEEPTPQWDLYSAGVILWEALTGASPFQGETASEVRAQVLAGISSRLREQRPDVSPALAEVVEQLVCVLPFQRPVDAKYALKLLRLSPEYEMAHTTNEFGSSRRMASAPPRADEIPQDVPMRSVPLPGVGRRQGGMASRALWLLGILLGVIVLAVVIWFWR